MADPAALTAQLLQIQLQAYEEQLLASPRYAASGNLARFHHQVFSQYGEDGVIAEIYRRIGATTRTFVECGVGNGLENNTVYPAPAGMAACVGGWLREAGRRHPHGVCAPDRSGPGIRPRVVVIEYNALYPPPVDWIVEYRAERAWKGTSYFGASLCAYERLGREKGYALVGCSLNGVNAFFVREELCGDLFDAPFTAARHYEPVRYILIRRNGFPRAIGDDL